MKPNFIFKILLTLCAAALLTACWAQEPKTNSGTDFLRGIACVDGKNYTKDFIDTFYLNGGLGGDALGEYGGTGGTSCTAPMPEKWHEGLTATVRWTHALAYQRENTDKKEKTIWKEKIVPVPYYDKLQNVDVYFLPNDEVKVLIRSEQEMANPSVKNPTQPPKGWLRGQSDQTKFHCENVILTNMTVKECVQIFNEEVGNTPEKIKAQMISSCQVDPLLETKTVPQSRSPMAAVEPEPLLLPNETVSQCIKRKFPQEWAKNELGIREYSAKFPRERKPYRLETQGVK